MTEFAQVRKGPKRSDSDQNGPPARSEKSESPYRTRTSDRAVRTGPDSRPVKVSELLLRTFGGTVYATQGGRTWGVKPDWLDWPSHTAAEMGSGPDINPTAFARAPVKGVRGWRK